MRSSQSPIVVELTAVPLELRALRLDDVRRRASRRSARSTSIRSARSISLRRRCALGLRRCRSSSARSGLHDRVEDPLLVARAASRQRAAAAEHARPPSARVLERVSSRPRTRPYASGHGATIEPRLARGQVRPDLLGHVRHHRMQQRQQPLERGERGRARVLVAVVESRLDRLRVPVAEVVERQVVERGRPRARSRTPRDPPRPRRAPRRSARGSSAPRPSGAAPRHRLRPARASDASDVPELVRELAALLDRAVRRTGRPGSTTSSAARSGSRPRRTGRSASSRVDAGAEALRHRACRRPRASSSG